MIDVFQLTIIGERVNVLLTTKSFGEVHPKRDDFATQLGRLNEVTGKEAILFPQLAFTNQFVEGDATQEGNIETFPDAQGNLLEGFLRSPFKADAGISTSLPVGICNGDCPVGIILTTPDSIGQRKLALMHLGLMSMISKTGRTSLIEETVQAIRQQGLEVEAFWMGFGAESCCYGLGHGDDRWPIIEQWQPEMVEVTKGPRQGDRGVDLGIIATNQLLALGIPAEKIEVNEYCTCCSGNAPEDGQHFSNLMRHGATARNAVVAWLK
jgi:copper oxidase (laccase) domain-containing protein